ncbi:MAG: phosphoribosylamine--glycine ligase [Actinomycetota bacterium]|nr:phosphoribosylamine--glycine ligase [Actinomycetota bacterium]
MRVLLLGSGGREHALGWKFAQSELLTELISCPGNPGLASIGSIVSDVDPSDPAAVVSLAKTRGVDLVIIGPEAPLAAGVADALRAADIPVFGPTAAGAMLESSKSFAKDVMAAAGVPTAAASTFTDRSQAVKYLERSSGPFVVKADGLAAGKGVLVTESIAKASDWVDECLGGRFGSAGSSVVIEEFLDGDEVSVFFLCSNGEAVPFEPARDYKRLLDGDQGPNTGGMGSFSPVSGLPSDLVEWTRSEVVIPTLAELAKRGTDYTGFLYVGLILTASGPQVIEFNVRLGDPETQALMPRLASDLLASIVAAIAGDITGAELSWLGLTTVNVVLAAGGYPINPQSGDVIEYAADPSIRDAIVFHAGTEVKEGHLVTAGGRVLNVVGIGETITEARSNAYAVAATIKYSNKRFRTDIGA